MNKIGALLIALAACGGGKDDKGGEGGGAGKTSGKGGCETAAKKPAELVTTKTVGFLAPFEKLAIGMSRDEVAKLCPNFFADADAAKKTGTFSVNEIVGQFGEEYAQARFEFVNDKLESIAYSLPPEIGDALTASWGAPKASSGAEVAHAWFDEGKRVRAILEPPSYDKRRELNVSSYMPLDAFIEPETNRIAWKPQDVLGKQPADLAKALPQYLVAVKTSAATKAKTDEMMKELNKEVEALGIDTKRNENLPEIELPPSPFEDGRATRVTLHTDDDGSLRAYTVAFDTGSLTPAFSFPEQSAAIVKLLDEKWGPHKTLKETLGETMHWYDAKRGLRATARSDKPEGIDVGFSRYMPLATIFGAPGATWGFEKAERPLIGATPDEIAAAYKEYEVKRDDANKTVTLIMPPTDYEGDTGSTRILMFVRDGGKVGEYRFNLPYREFPEAKAAYEAALEAKLGKPGKEKYGDTPYGKNVKVRWSDITDTVDIQVGGK